MNPTHLAETQRQTLLAIHNQRAEMMMYTLLVAVLIAVVFALLYLLRFIIIETLISIFQSLRPLRIQRAHHANNHTRPLPAPAPKIAAHETEAMRREPQHRAA